MNAKTQDFVLISHPVFVTKDVEEFYRLILARTTSYRALLWFLLNPFEGHWRIARNLWSSLRRHSNPLAIRYWSTTPYALGANCAVKYSAQPKLSASAESPQVGDDFLRTAMKASLNKGEAVFDFMVQLQTDPMHMPIEDPGVEWKEQESPFHKVATVRILKQKFDTPARDELAENLSFTPWHSLPDHRPLGGINRARKIVYEAISLYRHHANRTRRSEPDSIPDVEFTER